MGVTSVRFNDKELKILDALKKHYNCDSSTLIKRSLFELYEVLKDKERISAFEKKEASGEAGFFTIDEII